MKTAVAALVLAFAPAVPAQEGDKIGKEKAPAIARKVLVEVQKRKSAAIAEAAAISLPQQSISASFTGILKKEFAAVKGSAEVYAKSASYLVRSGDQYAPPETIKGQEASNALAFKNPAVILIEVGRLTAAAAFAGDETINDKDCRILSLAGDEDHVKQHLKELGARLGSVIRSLPGSFDPGNLATYFDTKLSKSIYKMWIGKADLQVYRIDWIFSTQPKHGTGGTPGVPPLMLGVSTSVTFSKWDEDVELDIPGPVKSKFGIK